jgi:hypothetical protein
LPDIARHPFLTASKIPIQLPTNATHVAPEWRENEFGELVFKDQGHDSEHAAIGKKIDAAPTSTRQSRRPFTSRDPNTEKVGNAIISDDRLGQKKHFMEAAAEKVEKGGKVKTPSERVAHASSRFPIHDDFEPTSSEVMFSNSKKPSQSRAELILHDEAELIARTAAVSLRQTPPSCSEPAESFHPDSDAASMTSAVVNSKMEQDMLILKQMHDRLTAVLDVTESRKHAYGQQPCSARPVAKGGPSKWVVRYVDYTSKYGLGFLLSDGR